MFMDQEFYGCEFLDLEEYQAPRPLEIVKINLQLLERMVDPIYLEKIKIEDQERLNSLRESINKFGFLEPGTLIISNLRIKLQDGNHRFIIAKEKALNTFNVKIEYTDGKLNAGLSIQEFLKEKILSQKNFFLD